MALFGGGKPDHPMADIKQAKKLISELPANDSLKALDEVTFWLDSVSRTEGFRLDYRFELFDLLDQAAKTHQRKLGQEYLATDRQEKFRENKLWNTLFEFWKMLGDAYSQCVEQFQAGASGAGAIKKDLSAIIARVLRTLTLQLKWIMLRYGPVVDRVWGELGRLYLFAEAKGMPTVSVAIYPGAHGQGTVQQEFLKAMMLGISSTDGLTPIKQEIAERTVAHFGSLFTLQAKPAAGCNYYFDLSMRKPAARVQKSIEPNPTTRYFGAGKALPALQQLIQEIKTKGGVPSHVNLGGTYDADLVLSVMQHLAMYWSDSPPARNSERRKIATRMTVVHGFRNMLRSVAPAADDISLDFQAQDGSESWIVENVSDGGFGAIIPQVKGDWIKVGNLLAVQTETAQFWGAGVVRRITRDEFQQRRVGIQVLSSAVIPVKLSPAGNVSSFNATREGDSALLLSTAPDNNGEIALLLRAGSFTPGQALEMNVRGRQYYLMPSKMAEGGDDFDWAKFKVMQRT
ncbi:MAG: hypothetical protein HY525_13975 [Betaproteobacteria bacterium]|nr:hypothetical protein [Betaproteobacteria bacterium]